MFQLEVLSFERGSWHPGMTAYKMSHGEPWNKGIGEPRFRERGLTVACTPVRCTVFCGGSSHSRGKSVLR